MRHINFILVAIIFSISSAYACSDKQSEAVTHVVEIKNFSFVPDVLDLAVGDKVVWINRDTIEHNIVDSGSQKTLSQTLAQGDKFSYIVKEGMNYECGFHPSMTGVIHLNAE